MVFDSEIYQYTGYDQECIDEPKGLRPERIDHAQIMTAVKKLKSFSSNEVKNALDNGPVMATIRAGSPTFRHYGAGVIDAEDCDSKYQGKDNPDHSVLIVGYGDFLGREYFLFKNSFSKSWGTQGYGRVASSNMNAPGGVCGILQNLY